MPSVWFVTRHEGAYDWAKQKGILDDGAYAVNLVSEIRPEQVAMDDYVIGTLPVHLVAEICARGAHYLHLAMDVPAHRRGTELSAAEMEAFGATCREFLVLPSTGDIAAQSTRLRPAAGEGVHVCIVSEQYLANLLPVLKRRPAHVELISTDKVEAGRKKLGNALLRFGYNETRVSCRTINPASSTDFAIARAAARKVRETLLDKYPGHTLTVNATGGTKILSSAFLLEFHGFEVIYTDSQNGACIRFMDTQPREAEPIGSQITRIEDYLYCQGYTIEKAASDKKGYANTVDARFSVTELLLAHRGHTLSKFNDAAQKALRDIFGPKMGKHEPEPQKKAKLDKALPVRAIPKLTDREAAFCDRLVSAGMLLKTELGDYAFAGAEAMQYLTGGWIEEWAWAVARDCLPDDFKANVTVSFLDKSENSSSDDASDNELDLVVLHDNRLLIAECKTIDWKGGSAKQEIFNKLDALGTHARGLFGKSMLISAKPLDEKARRRADAYGIQVIEAHSLGRLKKEIQRWMGKH
ncbi:CRISPR-associated protein Csx16 [Azonexus sp.]|uniref:CRISPR-associated protein Csx16 n=1 Tax=Azonexus sp. TaxID=1872668 RepID=UPI0035AE0EC9